MDLSPNDIRNFEFPSQLRGYDKDEVDSFKEKVAEAIETLKQENMKQSMEIDSLKSQLSGLRQFEDTIKSAAIDARRNADITIANAKKEAELFLNKARSEAQNIISSHRQQMDDIESQITKLKLARNSYLTKLRQLISNHMELVGEIAKEEEATKAREDKLEITDSTELENAKRETVATEPSTDSIKTEDAQATGAIVAVAASEESEVASVEEAPEEEMQETASEMPEQLKDAIKDEAAQESSKPIDPELAAALESYQKNVASAPDEEEAESQLPPAPAQDEVVETTARAEDVPDGFVATDGDEVKLNTDRVQVAPEAQDQPTEHNTIDIDDQPETDPNVGPDNLAAELDKVVAKFEEEMDKAEKT